MFQPVKTSAVTLGAFRPCPHGHGLAYRGTLEKTGSAAAAALVGAAVRIANISETGRQQSTATLDVLDAEDNIVQDYSIPTEHAWNWWVPAAGLQRTAADCRICDPAVWRATDPSRRTRAP